MKRLTLILLACIFSFQASAETNLCVRDGYVVVYFNGAWNTLAQSAQNLERVRGIRGVTYNSETVSYELFYNGTSGEIASDNFQSIAGNFLQRAIAIDPSLSERYDVLLSAIWANSDGFLDRIRSVITSPTNTSRVALEALYNRTLTDLTGEASGLFSNPPTFSSYEIQNTRLTTLTAQGTKLLLIAHNQGNIFVNQAYEYILSQTNYSLSNVQVLHIAPTSIVTNNESYILGDRDLVINGLERTGSISSAQESNVSFSAEQITSDFSGHTLASYLMVNSRSRTMIVGDIDNLLSELETPDFIATQGLFTATLTWDGTGDVDLHTYEPESFGPTNGHVFYIQKVGNAGYLDVDNVVSYGPEHYYLSCDEDKIELGTYIFGVNDYRAAEGRKATVQISTTRDANLITKTIILGPEQFDAGDNPPPLINVVVSKDDNGKYSVTAN